MCGIAGALLYDPGRGDLQLFFQVVRECRRRGEDSFGVVRWSPEAGWKELRRAHCAVEECSEFFVGDQLTEPQFFLHTSRAEPTTEFKVYKTERDIPPFRQEDIAVAHNGIIANDEQLATRYQIERPTTIDTAVVPGLVLHLGFWRAIGELQGGSALGVIDGRCGSLYLARNFLPLTVVWQPGLLAFASEACFFRGARDLFPPFRIWDVPPYTALEFSARGYRRPIPWGALPDEADGGYWEAYPQF